jgi:hypothetical protein
MLHCRIALCSNADAIWRPRGYGRGLPGVDQKVGVNPCRLQGGVSKHGLNIINIRAVLLHEGGEGVAERAATAGPAHPGNWWDPHQTPKTIADSFGSVSVNPIISEIIY